MDRLRSLLRTLGVSAFLICALSVAGLGTSHARPSHASQSIHRNALPCNAACKAYMNWSHRIAAMFRPSRHVRMLHAARPQRTTAVHHARALRTVAHHAPRTRQRALNSFAQLPVQSDTTIETPTTAETPQQATSQTEDAPSRPMDQIAGRFPAAAEFLTARGVGAESTRNDAAEGMVTAGAEIAAAMRGSGTVGSLAAGTDMRLIAALLLALCTLPTLRFFMEVDRQARRGPRAQPAFET